MLPLGTHLPSFSLTSAVDGKVVSAEGLKGAPALLLMFICNHCPFVIHVRDEFSRIEKVYSDRGLSIVAINSNSLQTHPQDGPESMKRLALEMGWKFPFLFDDKQEVAKAFRAACTPDFYLFDKDQKLVYRGQLDDSRPGSSIPVTGKDVKDAIDAVLAGKPVAATQKPSIGCNIKWSPGNEPSYYG